MIRSNDILVVGYTSLHLAARKNELLCMKLLVIMGSNVNYTNIENMTPLHVAALGYTSSTPCPLLFISPHPPC